MLRIWGGSGGEGNTFLEKLVAEVKLNLFCGRFPLNNATFV